MAIENCEQMKWSISLYSVMVAIALTFVILIWYKIADRFEERQDALANPFLSICRGGSRFPRLRPIHAARQLSTHFGEWIYKDGVLNVRDTSMFRSHRDHDVEQALEQGGLPLAALPSQGA